MTLSRSKILFVYKIFLLASVFDGALRYFLNEIGAIQLVYLPKFIMLSVILLNLLYGKNDNRKFYITSFLVICCIISLLKGQSYQEILTALNIFLPIVFGALFFKELKDGWKNLHSFHSICLMISLLGVFINYFYTFPWYGYTYNVGEIRLSAAVNWWAGEYARISGFSRASYDVATQITVLYVILLAYNIRFLYKILLTSLSFLAIILTTSKGILISIAIVLLFSLLQNLQPNRKYLALLSFAVLWFISVLVILLPFSSYIIDADFLRERTNNSRNIFLTAFTSFASFGDRLAVMWPATTTRFKSINDYLFGLGIGSVGTPQSLHRNDPLSAVDNVALYLISSFGIIGGILFISVPLNIVRLNYRLMFDRLFIYLSTILVSYGMFSNAVELSYFPLLFGLLLGQVFFSNGRNHEDSTYS